jgi:long-chain acyl-CoA synthetase
MNDAPWYKSYPSYVPHEINADHFKNLLELFDQSIVKFRDLTAFVNMNGSLTYGELDELSDAFGWYLQHKLGLKKGDRIAIQMPNLLQFPVAMFGAMKAGLIIVNTNPLYTSQEMRHQFNDAGVKALVILENFASHLQQIINETKIEKVVVARIGDMLGFKGHIVNFVVKYIKKMVPDYHLDKFVMFKDVLSQSKGKKPVRPEVLGSDTVFLQYTGGTTGVSKGAELTHRNICANMEMIYAWIGNKFEDGKEVIITALPLYHIFALTANCITFLSIGAKNILITNPRDMKAFLGEFKKYPPSYFTGVNTLFNGMMNQPQFMDLDFSKLKVSLGGGMAVQEAIAKRWKEMTGGDLLEGYGLSETSPVAVVSPTDGSHRIGWIGLPVPSTDIKIMDDDFKEVPLGEQGEIAIKGPQVMKGYWKRPDETEKVFKDGYFYSGDIGMMSEDGFVKIVDRKKEMINVSGFKVFPSEVEAVIAGHPKVLEVGVKSCPDEKTTEAVKAFIVKKDQSLTPEEIVEFCKDKLTSYKIPKHIVFRNELPKSNVGKILRRLME